MKKRFIVSMMICVMFGVVFSGCSKTPSKSDAKAVIPIRIAHDKSVDTPDHMAFLEFEKMVETKTNGKYDVIIFPGSQMGNGNETFEKARLGDLEMSVASTSLLIKNMPEVAVWESYFLFDDAAHAHRVLDSQTSQDLLKPLEKQNLVGLGYMEIGFRNFSNNRRPIEKVEDVAGLKIRGYNPIQIKAWETLGANTSTIAWNELFTSLQQGLIDGQECATTNFYSEKFYETQKHWSLTEHVYTNLVWFANKSFMDELDPEDRKTIEESAKETIAINRGLMAKSDADALVKLKDAGVMINEVSPEVKKQMGEKINNAIKDDLIAQCGQENYDAVMKEVAEQKK